ncbi:MAG: RNase adapter RapZ [Candidatus Paceibacterota bacterium]
MIQINSFSFVYTPIKINPEKDDTLQYIFDCRFIKNPGRIEELKNFTGLDVEIEKFFRKETDMIDFLEDNYKIIYKYLIEKNLSRHENIELNFGCTGGIHRSVFAAEYISKKLKFDFPKEIINISHLRLQTL